MATFLECKNSCTNFRHQLADQIVDYYTSYNNLHMTTSKLEKRGFIYHTTYQKKRYIYMAHHKFLLSHVDWRGGGMHYIVSSLGTLIWN